MKKARPITRHALMRVQDACQNILDADSQGEWQPGNDVSLFRALRELHRCLGGDDQLDPHRLVRYMLFNGLADMSSWTDGSHYCTTHQEYGDFCVR